MGAEIEKANRNSDYWRNEMENIRRFYEGKIAEKNKIIESKSKTVELIEIKKEYERTFDEARADYERQIKALAERVGSHPSTDVEYDELKKKYTQLELSYYDLMRNSSRSRQLSEGVDHLWTIKETEYSNVNEILRQARKRAPSHQNSGRNIQYGNDAANPYRRKI